jgi:MarR family transcriptional regulator for hemolysin
VLDYDFESSVGYWVTATSCAIRRAMESELEAERITVRQWEVLMHLSLAGELTQAELAERMNVDAPTLTGILTRMERDGWLERRGCPDDRRCKRIHPTERAEAVWHRMAACGHRTRLRATAGFSEDELQTLKSFCDRIRGNLGQAVAADTASQEAAEGTV